MPNWLKNIYRYFFKYPLRLISFAASFIFIFVIVVFTKLYISPIDLDPIKPKLEKYLAQQIPDMDIQFSQCYLTWMPREGGLVLNLGKTNVTHTKSHIPLLSAKKLLLDFHLLQLILQEKDVYKLVLIEPDVKYDLKKSHNASKITIPKVIPGLEIRNGRFDIIDGCNRWQASKVNVQFHRKGKHIYLNSVIPFSVTTAQLNADIKLNANIVDEISIHASIQDCHFKDLDKSWPEWLAPLPRQWVLTHIQSGQSDHADISAVLKKNGNQLDLIDLSGHIDIQDAKVAYLLDLPPVEHVSGQAWFDKKDFFIKVHTGTSEGMVLESGDIAIKDLPFPDQFIEIDLKVSAPIEKALEFLNHKQLNLVRHLNISTDEITGQSRTKLHLNFPLHTRLQLTDIKATAQSELIDVYLPNLFKIDGKAVPIQAEKLNFDLKNNTITTTGKINLLNETADVTWAHNFTTDKTRYLVNGSFHSTSLKKAKLGLPRFYRGRIDLNLDLTQEQKLLKSARFHANLTKADLIVPGIGNISQKDKVCEAEGLLEFKQGKLFDIQTLKIFGDKIDIKFQKDNEKKRYICEDAIWRGSKSKIILQLDDEATKINFSGKKLVIYPDGDSKKNNKTSTNLDITFDLDQLVIFSQGTLYNAKAFYSQRGHKITNFKLDAQQENTGSKLKIHTRKNGDILITSHNAGLLCRLLDISTTLQGGILTAQITPHEDGHLEGRFLIEDCYMTHTSPLTKLVGHASPLGVIDAVRGKNISLDQIKGDFYVEGGKTVITEGAAAGHTIGFTFNGSITEKEIKIYGTMMPVNFINKAISLVPIISHVFQEGFFGVTYQMQGDPTNPRISFNPLSAFAPGAFKQIFAKESWAKIPNKRAKEKAA